MRTKRTWVAVCFISFLLTSVLQFAQAKPAVNISRPPFIKVKSITVIQGAPQFLIAYQPSNGEAHYVDLATAVAYYQRRVFITLPADLVVIDRDVLSGQVLLWEWLNGRTRPLMDPGSGGTCGNEINFRSTYSIKSTDPIINGAYTLKLTVLWAADTCNNKVLFHSSLPTTTTYCWDSAVTVGGDTIHSSAAYEQALWHLHFRCTPITADRDRWIRAVVYASGGVSFATSDRP